MHFHYREVVADPLAAVRALYRRCGRQLDEEAGQRMTAFLARPRQAPTRRYSLAEFGLNAENLRERFSFYVRHFAVDRERASAG